MLMNLDFRDNVPVSEGGESISSVMDIEDEVRRRYDRYLTMSDNLTITDDLWVVGTGAGHAVSPDRRLFNW
ncbi:unnamed protein product [Phytophthora fragariaefolia]|uniref:Unnamed protein product n=1 Tax=Phytophthora fragariaefolia TaxID=1490495 RepID=A0A9W6XYG8_9STRA|nr:unnamed protein product [Phytophthora fragariaefolia]